MSKGESVDLEKDVRELQNEMASAKSDIKRLQDRRENDHTLLVEIREGLKSMEEAARSSTSKLHERIDQLQIDKATKTGYDEGAKAERVRIFKFLTAVATLIGILAYIGAKGS